MRSGGISSAGAVPDDLYSIFLPSDIVMVSHPARSATTTIAVHLSSKFGDMHILLETARFAQR